MKGFLFVVTVFLVLTYILLSISVWVKAIEASERTYSEFYKESNVELAMEQITSAKVDSVSSIIMNRALFKLSNYSVDHPFKQGSGKPGEPENYFVEKAFGQWLVDGTPTDVNFEDGKAPTPEKNSSLKAWVNNLNGSLSAIGVYIDGFSVSEFKLTQVDTQTLNYSYKISLSMKDKSGTTSVVRNYTRMASMNITGIPDPAINRASGGNLTSRRFFFYNEYDNPGKMAPKKIAITNPVAAHGCFYGYLVNATDAGKVNAAERGSTILVGSYTELVGVPNMEKFGAFIVTTSPNSGTTCDDGKNKFTGETDTFNAIKYTLAKSGIKTSCDISVLPGTATHIPFIVIPGFSTNQITPNCPNLFNTSDNVTRRCVLFQTAADSDKVQADPTRKTKGPMEMYDVESIRDFIMCGYYTRSMNGPSFIQRMFNNSFTMKDKNFGIETFLVGSYVDGAAGGAFSYGSISDLSKVDWELFTKVQDGVLVRGTPGCKDFNSCSSGTPPSPYTRFGISPVSRDAYGLKGISCDNNLFARCTQ